MRRYLIICASKYGSTIQTGRWIAERLDGETTVTRVEDMHDPGNADVIIFGSGIYHHRVLPELERYVNHYHEFLAGKKIAVFGVAIDLTGVYVKGGVHGGWNYILPFIESLLSPPVHAGLLGGEINPAKLDEKDREGLKKFYRMLGHKDDIPWKTKMTKQAAWNFAEKLMECLKKEDKE